MTGCYGNSYDLVTHCIKVVCKKDVVAFEAVPNEVIANNAAAFRLCNYNYYCNCIKNFNVNVRWKPGAFFTDAKP